MKITKFEQSCLLVEMPAPVNRTALFDPGAMSQEVLNIDDLVYLDDIIITHDHPDHLHLPTVERLVTKFPKVRITSTAAVVAQLQSVNITATAEASEGIVFFDAPHEKVEPISRQPESVGVHYLDLLTHPGDCHSFNETKAILALPITGPWGSTINATNLALKLKPQYVLPIHDWHWRTEAREQFYDTFEKLLGDQNITFLKLKTGQPVTIDV